MSSRYEREIDEILRKSAETHPSVSERMHSFRKPRQTTRGPLFPIDTFTGMAAGFVLAFLAATIKWIIQYDSGIWYFIAGFLAVAAFAVILLTFLAVWFARPKAPSASGRGYILDFPKNRNGGGNPFSKMVIGVRLFALRENYRRRLHSQ